MLPTPDTSPQREVLLNCTNVTPEPIRANSHKLPTPTSRRGLVKRSRPAIDGGARLKRLKFTIGESRTGEDEEESGVDSDESEEDDSIVSYQARQRRRTIFHAKNALAMARPGVTHRLLPCKSCSVLSRYHFVIDCSANPLTTPCLRVVSQDRCIHV
jgi:hypothetical protein